MLVIGIAGGTGSGKTTVARAIGSSLPADRVSMIEYDAYYRDRVDLSEEARAKEGCRGISTSSTGS